jgi:hypothetical protein
MAENEPIHPTYGTLDQLLAQIAATVRRGELVRMGHHGALSWFTQQYAECQQETPDES